MIEITEKHIAPCGMNCALCLNYLRSENKCPGCFSGRKVNGKTIKCARRLCKKRKSDFCFDCESFPCESLKKLDERYRKKYGMSEIENLEFIRDHGLKEFIEDQRQEYQSEKGNFCVHDRKYYL